MKDPKERLHDILDATNHIERYASRVREAFEREELIQVWVVHHLQINDSIDQRSLGPVETHHIDRVGELLENAAVVRTEVGKSQKLDLGEDGNAHPFRPPQTLV
jgi:hypothetical protein